MKELFKRQNGITLIALVITIIVLVILAGVSIAMVTGENGIIGRANDAVDLTKYKTAEEKVNLAVIGAMADDGEITVSELETEVGYQGGTVNGTTFPVEVQMDGYTFIVEATGKVTNQGDEGNKPTEEEASTSKSYVGYYADIEGDGIVDGIIYADLAIGGSGTWNNDSTSNYEYAQVTEGLKSYSVSSENGTGFGSLKKPVITEKEGSTGKDRFYVMALEDFNSGTEYCWYDAAAGKLDNPTSRNFNDFGQGKVNTRTMIGKWNGSGYGPQDDSGTYKDMWGVIQKADNTGKKWDLNKWFVPAKAEWAAFGDMTVTKMGVTTSNYDSFGLEIGYLSSSQCSTVNIYGPNFHMGNITVDGVLDGRAVRLSATF